MQVWERVKEEGGGGANITTAYINDIPGNGVKKSLSACHTAFVNNL